MERAFPRKWEKDKQLSQSDLLSESMFVMTSEAAVGRDPGMASDQQTFCCQQGGGGPRQCGDGQVTIFLVLPGMNTVGGWGQQDGTMSETAL